jgi:putative transposase
MKAIHARTRGVYGSRRMIAELGEPIGRNRVARSMRANGLQPRVRRRFRITTDSSHTLPVAPNLLMQNFSTEGPNRVWTSDITYVWTAEGWAFADHMRQELCIRALQRALRRRRPAAGLVCHSDRGSQYASRCYRAVLADHEAASSMSRAGNCYDNAVTESFFASLKMECTRRTSFATRTEAYDAVSSYIDGFYNLERRHSSLQYLSPIDYEHRWSQTQAA